MRFRFEDCEIQTDHKIPARPSDNEQKNQNLLFMDFAIPADHRLKIKESEKRDKYLDFARELKKLWNMNVTVILIVIGTLGMISKGLISALEELEIRGGIETIQTTVLRSARMKKKCSVDLRRLAVTRTPVKDHRVTQV